MRKRTAALILCLLILAGIGKAAAAGGADDPLLSLSYLYNTYLPKLQALFARETEEGLGGLAEDYRGRLDAIPISEATAWDRAASLTALALEDGGSVRLAPFGKFVLSEGRARLQVAAGEVLDLSEGRVCADGEWLIPAHRYFAAEESEALIRVYSAALGFVDGYYLSEASGSFAAAERFPDIEGHWGRGSILALAEKGLVNGMEEHLFEPDRKVTRAMFVTILGRMCSADPAAAAATDFSDVGPGDWFASYVAWAAGYGIVTGYDDGTFAPNREITREQMALILIRCCDAFGLDLPETEEAVRFTDEASVSPWALDAVLRARRIGLINGRGDGSFDPLGTATRAEMCAVIARLMEKTETAAPDDGPEPPEKDPAEEQTPEEENKDDQAKDEEPPEDETPDDREDEDPDSRTDEDDRDDEDDWGDEDDDWGDEDDDWGDEDDDW